MAELIEKRYAQALFELGTDSGKLETLMSGAEALLPALTNDVFKALLHPAATPSEKISIVESLKGRVDDDLLGLCVLVIKKGREEYLRGILNTFIKMSRQHLGLTIAHVNSAVPLTDSQLAEITAKLSRQLNKQVTVRAEVHPELIAGLYVRVGGRVFDGTVKTELADIRRRLLNFKM